MTSSAVPPAGPGPAAASAPRPAPPLQQVLAEAWPEPRDLASPGRVVAAVAVGVVAALVLPGNAPGLATFLVLAGVIGVVAAADRRLRTPYHLGVLVLCTLLVATVLVRDALWVVALCLLAAFAVGAATLSAARSLPGLAAAQLAVPLAALRGLPWLGRSLAATRLHRSGLAAARTAAVSLALAVVFGLLFASADAVFASWAQALLPDLRVDTWFARVLVLLAVTGLTLAGVYVALVPPEVERLAVPAGSPVGRRFEWLVPVGVVTTAFGLFVVAQLAVLFGGHAYLRRTTGLTYAEYVHQGFGQLTVATVLTLGVVAAAARKASRATAGERLLVRGVLGLLCVLTLVVVASALYRMALYEDAYGFTRLRLLVSVFEGWLGVVLLLVLAAGVRLRGGWVPRAVLLSGAVALLGLAAMDPDAFVARHNVERYQHTGKVDIAYLQGLSADAVPVLAGSGIELGCLGVPSDQGWLEWNLGRSRARAALAQVAGTRTAPVCTW